MIGDMVIAVAEAAIIEAQTVPKLLERDGVLVWRCLGGLLCKLTTDGRHFAMQWSTP